MNSHVLPVCDTHPWSADFLTVADLAARLGTEVEFDRRHSYPWGVAIPVLLVTELINLYLIRHSLVLWFFIVDALCGLICALSSYRPDRIRW